MSGTYVCKHSARFGLWSPCKGIKTLWTLLDVALLLLVAKGTHLQFKHLGPKNIGPPHCEYRK